MSRKRRHRERQVRLQARAHRDMPEVLANALAVDVSALAPCNSYGEADFVERGVYIDKPFTCQTCGKSEVWTAAQQKWWYEVAKGDRFSTAKLCRPCRRQERTRREEARRKGGDPNPYKNPGLILAKIRSEIEPRLLSAGYRLNARSRPNAPRAQFIEYSRPDALFTLLWNQHIARLTAEFLAEGTTEIRTIGSADLSGARSNLEIQERLDQLLTAVRCFVDSPEDETAERERAEEPVASDHETRAAPRTK